MSMRDHQWYVESRDMYFLQEKWLRKGEKKEELIFESNMF